MTFNIYSNNSVFFKHPSFDSNWSLSFLILCDSDTMMQFVVPYDSILRYSQYYVCKVHLTNVFFGDINKLTISGSQIDLKPNDKETIRTLFDELGKLLLLDINYDLD